MIRVQVNLTLDLDLGKVPDELVEWCQGDASLIAASLIYRDHAALTPVDRRAFIVGFPDPKVQP